MSRHQVKALFRAFVAPRQEIEDAGGDEAHGDLHGVVRALEFRVARLDVEPVAAEVGR